MLCNVNIGASFGYISQNEFLQCSWYRSGHFLITLLKTIEKCKENIFSQHAIWRIVLTMQFSQNILSQFFVKLNFVFFSFFWIWLSLVSTQNTCNSWLSKLWWLINKSLHNWFESKRNGIFQIIHNWVSIKSNNKSISLYIK